MPHVSRANVVARHFIPCLHIHVLVCWCAGVGSTANLPYAQSAIDTIIYQHAIARSTRGKTFDYLITRIAGIAQLRARAQLIIGRCHRQLKNFSEAERVFRSAQKDITGLSKVRQTQLQEQVLDLEVALSTVVRKRGNNPGKGDATPCTHRTDPRSFRKEGRRSGWQSERERERARLRVRTIAGVCTLDAPPEPPPAPSAVCIDTRTQFCVS